MNVEHSDGKLVARGLFSPCSERHPALFTKERKETRATTGRVERRSIPKWEGEALLINTIVNGANGTSYTQMDRWRLSRDGQILRIRRQFVNMHGETESELVYSVQASTGE
jgi:hypothetical protein